MRLEDKEILWSMIFHKLMETYRLPRGSAKSITSIWVRNYCEAIRRTNYVLEAIGEKYTI